MTDNDVDWTLKKKWVEVLNPYNEEFISQQIKQLANSLVTEPILRYRGKFYFVVGRYEQAIADLTKLLELDANDLFALKYRGEAYYMMKIYEESLVDLNKLSIINANDEWILKARKRIIRE
jgi:tetratricopeptide (TPR) repeat protein